MIKILIVDDDELFSKQLAKLLKDDFYETYVAHRGDEAIKCFTDNAIDICVLDLNLPDVSGFKLLEKMKEQNPHCEVVIITGYGTQEIAIKAIKNGALDVIEKPIDIDMLYTALGRAQEKLVHSGIAVSKNTVLLIDDDKEIVAAYEKTLKHEGFRILTAYDAKTGIEIVKDEKVDVIVTDIKMQDMSGFDVLKTAKSLYKDIEVILITGSADRELAVEALHLGAIDYINKPINVDELIISVKKALERVRFVRNNLYRRREQAISSEIVAKMNEELEKTVIEKTKELNQTQAQLFQTAKLTTLGEMSAGLAHEINQPLGAIGLVAESFSKLLNKDRLSKEEITLGLVDIKVSVKRIAGIIQHIRTFARQDTLEFVEVDVNETINSALGLMGEQLRIHEVAVERTLCADLPKIEGEPYQLEQVWINLMSNARDSVAEKESSLKNAKPDYKKRLAISTVYDSGLKQVKVCFSDTGTGISKENIDRVFEPFFTTKEVGRATGLGLSISHGIIESHKGKIEIENNEAEGVTVCVTFPAI